MREERKSVEAPNKGHFRNNINSAAVFPCREVVLFWRFNMYWNYRKNLGTSPSVLCRGLSSLEDLGGREYLRTSPSVLCRGLSSLDV
jgi:hypothetical protein